MVDEGFTWDPLFFAMPEITLRKEIMEYLHRQGAITNDGLKAIENATKGYQWKNRVQKQIQGKPLMGRLLGIAPELFNRKMTDLLKRFGYINKEQAALLNLYIGVFDRAGGGMPGNVQQAVLRSVRVFGVDFVSDLLSVMVTSDQMTLRQASIIRSEIAAGKIAIESIKAIRRAKSVSEAMMLVGSNLVDRRTLRMLRLAGLINTRTEETLLSALSYGSSQWTVFQGSKRADGLAARMAYVLSGTFSFEMVDFLKAARRLTPSQAILLETAVSISQSYNRRLMEEMTDRRFRVVPGERPIVTYLRSSKTTEEDLLRMLSKAARRARGEAAALAARGSVARGAEYTLRARALHQTIRQIWEGVGYLTIFGEKEVGEAAISASEALQKRFYNRLPEEVQRMLEFQARSGLDSFISRKENTVALSRRVYKNMDLWTKKVDDEINIGLLNGSSAEEIAKAVEGMINPKVMGGVKYAAMRLGRTELSNAFHYTTIRHTREQPWHRGYKWNKSSSHKRADVCDQMASEDHDGLGPGVYKKSNVPGKPHPHCFCYVTVVSMTDKEFIAAYNAGRFTRYLSTVIDDKPGDTAIDRKFGLTPGAAAEAAGNVVVSQALKALKK